MCTAITFQSSEGNCFFGRNMDLAYFFNQSPMCISKNATYYDNVSKETVVIKRAILGMGTIIDEHPAMADAMNENGLACAGLNFERYAHFEEQPNVAKINLAPYDLILWMLSNFDTVEQVKTAIADIDLVNIPINEKTPVATLHWMVADRTGKSIVIEKTKEKLAVYDNPVGVLTNDPTFDWHVTNLNEYINLKPQHSPSVRWSEKELKGLGIGIGTLGMPGDFSSVSRFVRIAYLRAHLPKIESDAQAVSQLFHMLENTAMVKGGVMTDSGLEDYTQYSSCMDLKNGVYYYKTYENNRINAVDLKKENLTHGNIQLFPYKTEQDISFLN